VERFAIAHPLDDADGSSNGGTGEKSPLSTREVVMPGFSYKSVPPPKLYVSICIANPLLRPPSPVLYVSHPRITLNLNSPLGSRRSIHLSSHTPPLNRVQQHDVQ
jgi:hypothetical protein